MRRLRLRPVPGSTSLWDMSTGKPLAIELAELAIDDALRTRLQEWLQACAREEARRRTRSSMAVTIRLFAEGEHLAQAIAAALGPQVEFVLELPDHAF